ncbi:MAG: hypothetical protein LBE91_00550 [Tannerella sp.]|nr:hypothetical protein [Tannerella sp.]
MRETANTAGNATLTCGYENLSFQDARSHPATSDVCIVGAYGIRRLIE